MRIHFYQLGSCQLSTLINYGINYSEDTSSNFKSYLSVRDKLRQSILMTNPAQLNFLLRMRCCVFSHGFNVSSKYKTLSFCVKLIRISMTQCRRSKLIFMLIFLFLLSSTVRIWPMRTELLSRLWTPSNLRKGGFGQAKMDGKSIWIELWITTVRHELSFLCESLSTFLSLLAAQL